MADLAPTAANVIASSAAVRMNVTAGGTITAGMPVAKAADGKYDPCNRTDATLSQVVGIALHAASDTQPLEIVVEDPDLDLGCVLTVGTVYVASDAGTISPAADLAIADYTCVLGIARAADSLEMKIIKDVGALIPA